MAAVITDPQSSARNVIQPTGNFVALTLRGNAAQTVPLLEIQDSSSNNLAILAITQQTTPSTISPTPLAYNQFEGTSATTAGNFIAGVASIFTMNPATPSSDILMAGLFETMTAGSQNNPGQIYGQYVRCSHSGTGTLAGCTGIFLETRKTSTGVLASAIGLDARLHNLNATGVITSGVGIRINGPVLTGGITTCDGLRIENQGGAGVTTARGLLINTQSGAGTNIAMQVGTGNLGFNGATPVVKQTGASAAGIAAIVDANAKAAVSALQTALANYGFVTSPA